MTTTEKNAEIARWMGAKQYTSYFKFGAKTHPEIFDFGNGKTFKQRQLKYHSDWNWIMLCAERIVDCMGEGSFEFKYRVNYTEIKMNNQLSMALDTSLHILEDNNGITGAHEAVYQFVVWHNQQQES